MKKSLFFILGLGLLSSIGCYAQEDAHLKRMTDDLLQLRKQNVSSDALNKIVVGWSISQKPKITLMDEIKRDITNEFRGKGANKFKMNQIVTHVYNRQNTGMVSKGDYFNSTEKDIYYSAIEKNIRGKSTATYTLTGHVGVQEFVFMSFNPKTKFSARVCGMVAKPIVGKSGTLSVKLPKVTKDKKIEIAITNESGSNESFIILNHNPQK